jgi:hypothetical protein
MFGGKYRRKKTQRAQQKRRPIKSKILERHVSGKCDDCDDLVKKGEKERQKEVEK